MADHGHPAPHLPPYDGTPIGVRRIADMTTAAALIGAACAGCQECQDRLRPEVLAGDRLVLVNLAGATIAPLASADLGGPATQRIVALVREALTTQDARALWVAVEGLDDAEQSELLDDLLHAATGLVAATGTLEQG